MGKQQQILKLNRGKQMLQPKQQQQGKSRFVLFFSLKPDWIKTCFHQVKTPKENLAILSKNTYWLEVFIYSFCVSYKIKLPREKWSICLFLPSTIIKPHVQTNLLTKENLPVFPTCILPIIHPFASITSSTWNLCAVFNKSWCECRKYLGKMLCVKKRSCYSVMD